MAVFTSETSFFFGKRPPAGRLVARMVCPIVCLGLCLPMLATLPGCSGCRKTPEEIQAERAKREAERLAEERRKKEEEKPNLETRNLVAQPHGPKPVSCVYKPGHWTAVTLPARANNFDVLGDLETTVIEGDGNPVHLVATPYTSSGSRQIALSKGRWKSLQSVLFVPAPGQGAKVRGTIDAYKERRVAQEETHLLTRMPSYQYHFVVLARWPANYKYLETLDSVKRQADLQFGGATRAFYRIQLLQGDKATSLPRYGLFWTSMAYLLWDDAEPDTLEPEQQVALLDWLHWGGQLIISGPESLDGLAGSFLADYLPATSGGTQKLTEADLDPLNRWWTNDGEQKSRRRLAPIEPWTGVKLQKDPQAQDVPGTGGLLAERRVGRGRIVVSAFELNEPELVKWHGFDCFFNACLLRRPPRRFSQGRDDLETQVTWADGKFGTFDARADCKLRYLSRDTGTKTTVYPKELGSAGTPITPSISESLALLDPAEEVREEYGPDVGSWSDFNSVANTARDSLLNAARIEIPDRMFVIWVVGVYVLALVPVNWMLFRTVDRVEWAWVAAPVIAVVCTAVVIRLAQLDIGFARSQTEINIVEIQGDYSRAHVTRYTALYTALSTTYRIRFDDPGAQVQPFSVHGSPQEFRFLPGERPRTLEYRYGTEVSMRGFRVQSNTTGLVHGEQMVDLGGPIALEETPTRGYQVVNQTAFTLREAGVIRRNASGGLETAWVGTLEPGKAAPLDFRPWRRSEATERLWAARRDRSPLTAAAQPDGQLTLRGLVDLVEDHEQLRSAGAGGRGTGDDQELQPGDLRELCPGDVKLVGWFDERIPGMEVRPLAPQSQYAALVVAHLRYGHENDPRPDANSRRQLEREENAPRIFDASSLGAGTTQ